MSKSELKLSQIKLFLTDIDGVWTDGGMYYDTSGLETKRFNTSDSAGVLFLRMLEIKTIIITGENSIIVKDRASKLGIEAFLGVKNKLLLAESICDKEGLDLKNIAYIGDDINDMMLLQRVGLSCTPANAPPYIKKLTNWQLEVSGGGGAYRAFVEKFLSETGKIDYVLEKYKYEQGTFNQ